MPADTPTTGAGLPDAARRHWIALGGSALAGLSLLAPVAPVLATPRTVGHKFMEKVAVLPPSSYHMTVLGCADDEHRTAGVWPRDVPTDATMAQCDAALARKVPVWNLGAPEFCTFDDMYAFRRRFYIV